MHLLQVPKSSASLVTGKVGLSLLYRVLTCPLSGKISWMTGSMCCQECAVEIRWWRGKTRCCEWLSGVDECIRTWWALRSFDAAGLVFFHSDVKVTWCVLRPLTHTHCESCSCRYAGCRVMTSCPRWVWRSLLCHLHSRPFLLCHSPFAPEIQMKIRLRY